MIRLGNDYSYGALSEVLQYLVDINKVGYAGYGEDRITEDMRRTLLDKCRLKDGDVFFLTGGTQTNIVALDWFLRSGEGVLCTEGAHINVHEAGAIEAMGHKVIPLPSDQGKLSAQTIEKYMTDFLADLTWPHMVVPGCVYLSQPTEIGTLYSLDELKELKTVCDKFSLNLYIDGARLIYALGSNKNNVSLHDLALLTDGFYIGGTKCGTLFGEAFVLTHTLSDRDRNRLFGLIKRHGALLAKGWLAAAQFKVLFKNDLYLEVGKNAVDKALSLAKSMQHIGIRTLWDSPTNQQFFILPTSIIGTLAQHVAFDVWGAPGEKETVIRLVTDWNTSQNDIDEVVAIIKKLSKEF